MLRTARFAIAGMFALAICCSGSASAQNWQMAAPPGQGVHEGVNRFPTAQSQVLVQYRQTANPIAAEPSGPTRFCSTCGNAAFDCRCRTSAPCQRCANGLCPEGCSCPCHSSNGRCLCGCPPGCCKCEACPPGCACPCCTSSRAERTIARSPAYRSSGAAAGPHSHIVNAVPVTHTTMMRPSVPDDATSLASATPF
jgi:hypothetical protein